MFAKDPRRAGNGRPKSRFPARDPKAPPRLIDLTKFYNAALTDSWHGGTGNDLADLPRGLQTLAGGEFDLRGLVQMGSHSPSASKFPKEIKGIKVNLECLGLHFLHAAAFGTSQYEGKQIGAYVVHYATNQMRLEIPIIYGHEVRDWHKFPNEPTAPKELTVVWTGSNAVSKREGHSLRLFMTTWVNPAPTVPIESIDILGGQTVPALFLVAITAE